MLNAEALFMKLAAKNAVSWLPETGRRRPNEQIMQHKRMFCDAVNDGQLNLFNLIQFNQYVQIILYSRALLRSDISLPTEQKASGLGEEVRSRGHFQQLAPQA
jgi:hypothetical protein